MDYLVKGMSEIDARSAFENLICDTYCDGNCSYRCIRCNVYSLPDGCPVKMP